MEYRIVMIGPHGERDYVEKILDGGLPCVGGADIEYAGLFPETCAKNIVKKIRKNWLNPHVAVEVEKVTNNAPAQGRGVAPAAGSFTADNKGEQA